MRNVLHVQFDCIEVILDKPNVSFCRVWDESNNTIRKTSIDSKNSVFRNIGRYGDAQRARLP